MMASCHSAVPEFPCGENGWAERSLLSFPPTIMSDPPLGLRAVQSIPGSPRSNPFRSLSRRAGLWRGKACGGPALAGRFSVFCLIGASMLQSILAATTVLVTKDWVSAKVQVASSKPSATTPPGFLWSQEHEGIAEVDLKLSQTGRDPVYGESFTGHAFAEIGAFLDLSDVNTNLGSTVLFGSRLLADDTRGCDAQSTLESIWRISVVGDAIPFYAGGLVDFGHEMDFTLLNFTTGQEVFSSSIKGMAGFNHSGLLEQYNDYLLTLRQRALFGDGTVQFEFGFDGPTQIVFSNQRSSLSIPEPSSLLLLCTSSVLLARRRR